MDSSVSSKDEIWFLRVYHHISTGLYDPKPKSVTIEVLTHDGSRLGDLYDRYEMQIMIAPKSPRPRYLDVFEINFIFFF